MTAVRKVLLIDVYNLLSQEDFRLLLDTMDDIGSASCRFSNDTGKYWSDGFSDFYVMMLESGECHRDYNGEGTFTFLDDSYNDGYRVMYEILSKHLTRDQLMQAFVLWISW